MNKRFQRKNYYLLETIRAELCNKNVISFAIFDTLLLRKVLFPGDIVKLLSAWAEKKYSITEFLYLRGSVENELRQHSGREDLSLKEIYEELQSRHPEWPIGPLMEQELALELEYATPNPLLKGVYSEAVNAGKKIWLIADSNLPRDCIEVMLAKCGFTGYTKLFLSGERSILKSTGSLYRTILEEEQTDPSKWIHIGSNRQSDVAIPQQLGITAAYCPCPRDCYLAVCEEVRHKAETAAGHPIPETPLDDSINFSIRTAQKINARYTRTTAPREETVITVDHISMMFNMSSEKVDNIKEYIIRMLKHRLMFQEFWALQDVSFTVRRGEKVGLVGLNGSGKSTILKIVSGVMKPTKGNVRVNGSIAPLIELGAGFDFELSARENVYLNGAILGHSHDEMVKYYNSIIEFAELEAFQDVAIKNFSSGMIARLGFAIATSHVPDILIIDEILSVGDFAFQQKCHKKMEELTGRGATVLFVSHSAGDIVNMCDRAIWLDHGRMVEEGEAQFIVEKYLSRH